MKFLILSYFFIFFILSNYFPFTLQDIPVHCLKHQIVGVWELLASNLVKVKSGHEMKCGHQEPSEEISSAKAESPIAINNIYQIILKEDDTALLTIGKQTYSGSWTMVYDEGFNIEFGLYSFFAFSKYTITEDNGIKTLQSLCYSTLTGWYTSNDKLLRGCYRATKLGVDPSYVSWSVTKQNNMNVIPLALNTLAQYYPSFLETSQKVKKINLHEEYVQKLNSIKKSWTAGIYPEFKSKSVQQLNKFAGLFRFKSLDKKQFIKKNTRIYNNEFMRKLNPFRNSIKIVSNEERRIILPKNFDWKHLLKTSINQKNCGSCYVIATMQMLEARLKILYNHDVSLSVQHVLNCSFYNQGCNGGYPFLVMKFGNEFELLPETCQPYVGFQGVCSDSCEISSLPYIYKVADFKYLGGSYGKCNEKLMMEELYNNGPFVVSFEPEYDFILYKSGIYHKVENNLVTPPGDKPEWEKVDHSVLIVGWGEDELTREKFWLVQNTWGPDWGESGFFRIRRGIDESAIESICEVGTPIIIDNSTNVTLLPSKKFIPRKHPIIFKKDYLH